MSESLELNMLLRRKSFVDSVSQLKPKERMIINSSLLLTLANRDSNGSDTRLQINIIELWPGCSDPGIVHTSEIAGASTVIFGI